MTDPHEYEVNADPVSALVIDSALERNLAIIQLDELGDLSSLPLADSDPTRAERLHTVGASTRGSPSLWGYMSDNARDTFRDIDGEFDAMVVESDLLTNSGNSGGPVVNDAGEVVAVIFAHMTGARLPLATIVKRNDTPSLCT